jgi:hypothetical protein
VEVIPLEKKIFVRARRKAEEGENKPGYTVVGVTVADLQISAKHVRKVEIEQIADAIGAEVVYLKSSPNDHDFQEG